MLRTLLALCLSSALCSVSFAQEAAPLDGVGLHVTGQAPGTMSYVVTFHTRTFDLEGFRQAILAKSPAAEVDQIVKRMERQVAIDQKAFTTAVIAAGGRVSHQYWLVNACAIDVAPAAVPALTAMPNVAEIHANRTTMPFIKTSTNAANHNSDGANALGYKGANVCTAIMDTGQDAVSGATGKPHATYYINGDNTNTAGGGILGSRLVANVQCGAALPEDMHNHGTAVASEVAGAIWNLSGTADDGHAPLARIAGYSISDVASSGQSSEATMSAAWQKIAADKAKYGIVSANNSYSGTSCTTTDLIQKALDNCAYYADVLCCTAAGNGASNTTYSQSTANGLSVAAVNATAKTMAGFSSYGPLSCDAARFWPDISGCGVNTVMALRDAAASSWTASGTSMASPQVCGAATLVRSANPTLNAQETKAILLVTAESILAQNAGKTRNNFGLGFSRSDLAVNLALVTGSAFTRTLPNVATVHSFPIGVTAAKLHRVVLSWPRRLDTSTSSTWSNLKLTIKNGAVVIASSDAPANLYEFVDFTPAANATYTIEVAANSLEGGAAIEYSVAHNCLPIGYVAGAFSLFGTGCAGSVVGGPLLSAAGVPTLGNYWQVKLSLARANTPVAFDLGASNTMWGATPLPYNLAAILAPGCWINVSLDVTVSMTTDATGNASMFLRVPSAIGLLGQSVYVQWGVADPGVNPIGIVSTRGGKGTLGGQTP